MADRLKECVGTCFSAAFKIFRGRSLVDMARGCGRMLRFEYLTATARNNVSQQDRPSCRSQLLARFRLRNAQPLAGMSSFGRLFHAC